MSLQDDLGRLVAWQFSQLQGGQLAAMRQRSGMPASAVAKASGCTPDAYYSWEAGLSEPSTAQALAILDFYRLHSPNPGVKAARSQAAAAEAANAEQADRAAFRKAVAEKW
jgi:transcriptional regulator with XRE-family HTH domain